MRTGNQPEADRDASARVVVDLAGLTAADAPRAGGKAANLGELARARFRVPPVFVITTAAYDVIVAAEDLALPIAAARESGEGAAVRAAFEHAEIPDSLEREIIAAYRGLGGGPVAVRSSATAEDLAGAAFAGQQETFLGIADEAALMQAIRRCWASLWSERAIAYRQRLGFGDAPVSLAVIVQRLVAAEAAGVLFTANPITGARDETVIDATTGLGEALASGLVTPDHVVLRRTRLGWRMVERRMGRREVEIRALPDGGTTHVSGVASDAPALPDAVLRRLARLGAAIARHFGAPQDIEWAWANGKLYVLQSRPITALPEPPARPGWLQRSIPRGGPTEYFQVRPYPLDMTSWFPAMGAAIMRMLPMGKMPATFEGQLWIEEDGVVVRLADWPGISFTPSLLMIPLRMIPLALRYDPARWRDDPLLAEIMARTQALATRDLSQLSWAGLLEVTQEAMALPGDVVTLRRHYFPRALFAMGGLRLLLAGIGEGERFGALLSGVDNQTLAANRKLEELAAIIRGDPALATAFADHEASDLWQALEETSSGEAFLARLRSFLADHGHRESASPLLVSQPSWGDAPEIVLGILQGLSRAAPLARDLDPGWQQARDAVLANPEMQFAPLRALFLWLLSRTRHFSALREDTHFLMTMPMPVLRRAFLEMGRRLVGIGALSSAEEVFHLRYQELERLADAWPPPAHQARYLRDVARQRAERREALAGVALVDPGGIATDVPADALLSGTPGSPGVAEGPVRLVREATEFGRLRPGEILVAPYTNPSWTPLFRHAGAAIVDTGSAMSHAAIVAREYGVPAVMGTGDALQRLQDGQRVRVDGTRGLVFSVDGE